MEYGRGRRSSRYSEAYSDDEDLRRGKRRGRREKEGRSRRSSRYSESYSDDEGDRRERRRGERRGGRRGSESGSDYDTRSRRRGRGRRGRRGPTNIDDFDEEDWSGSESESGSDSYSSSSGSEDSLSDSDSERGRRRRLRSSASASELTNATWALGEGTEKDIEARIKSQQVDIKKLLSALSELQKKSGVKNLPTEKQKVLQKDLQKLEKLQNKREERRGDVSVLMQLIGQQMLLSEHLKDAIEIVRIKVSGAERERERERERVLCVKN